MRIFIGIDLDDAIRGKIAGFIEDVGGFAPEARWVRSESLHITLKFIGEQKEEQVAAIAERLRLVHSEPIEIRMAGYGFFPTPKAPRVFWIGIQAGTGLAALAEQIDDATGELDVPREKREFNPHSDTGAGWRPRQKKLGRSQMAQGRPAEFCFCGVAKAPCGHGRT